MKGRSEEGIALIAVLWSLVLLSIIAASVSWDARTSTRIARNMADNAGVRAAADAGIQRAILDLIGSAAQNEAGKFRADGTVYFWRFANCTVQISIQDELGKINLNQAPEALFAALFGSVGVELGVAQSLADAIADYRDSDNFARVRGAEEANYRAAGLTWGPKNAPFQTLEELQRVLGITAEIYRRVAPYLTIYSTAAINPSLAGPRLTEILRSAGFKDFVDSRGLAYSLRAEAKSSNGAVFVREAVVQIMPNGSIPILSWRQGAPKI